MPKFPNLPPKSPSLSLLADKCTSLLQLQQVHAQMIISSRIIHDNYAASRLLSSYALSTTSGDITHALKLFNSIPNPNNFMYNTMIRALAGSSNPSEALKLFVQMRRREILPGKHTFPFVLKACSNLKSLSGCRQVHPCVVKLGLDLDLHVVNGLVRGYSMGASLKDARQVFDEMVERNMRPFSGCQQIDPQVVKLGLDPDLLVVKLGLDSDLNTVNGLVRGNSMGASLKDARQVFDEMSERNLKVCANQKVGMRVSLKDARQVFDEMAKRNLKPLSGCQQIHPYDLTFVLGSDSHVVNGYSAAKSLEDARQMYDEMPERILAVWTSMICGYAQNGCFSEALLLFNQMVANGFDPNDATLASVLSACAHEECLILGQRIESFIRQKNTQLGTILGTALVDMYTKNGAVIKAKQVFNSIQDKNTATWNAMIHGFAVHGYSKEALDLFQSLERHGIAPNKVTFVAALSACSHGGFLQQGREIFDSMKRIYNIDPRIEHYGCMVDLLGRLGEVVEAEELIRTMKMDADVAIWGALLSACRRCGNVEVAERVVREIVELDPKNHGVYVVLSNMYAEVGRWEEALRLRKVMKEGKLKKIPGASLVDATRV